MKPLHEAATAHLDRLRRIREGEDVGLMTGIGPLDLYLEGIEAPWVMVVGARTGVGKTSFLLTVALSLAERGYAVDLYSLESPATQLSQRILAMMSGVDSRKIRIGHMSTGEMARFNSAMEDLRGFRLRVDDTYHRDMSGLARDLPKLGLPDLVMVDFLQMLPSRGNTALAYEEYMLQIAAGAGAIGRPVIVTSQISRGNRLAPAGPPQLSELRGAGGIEERADAVVLLHREQGSPDAEANLAKFRHGPTGKVELHFDERTTRFTAREVER